MCDPMDETTKLVAELNAKLQELEKDVLEYRQKMTLEFQKYAEDLLREVPKDVSETVSNTIAESIKGCRSLYPDRARPIESSAGSLRTQPQQTIFPLAAAFQRGDLGRAEEGARSPHEREKEFQGVFTPSYLPLLDSSSRERRSSPEPPLSPRHDLKGKGREMDPADNDTNTDPREIPDTPEAPRPATKRRNTDEVSVRSDWSDSESIVRRSALRRSSSSSKGQSPRRVRFDVMGEEVLPTSSPHPFKPIFPDTIPSASFPDSDDEEKIEDIRHPPPIRVSSTQRILEMQRKQQADDGTQWTTVSAPPDGSASVATSNNQDSSDSSSSDELEIGGSRKKQNLLKPLSSAGASGNSGETSKEQEQEETPSDDDDGLEFHPLTRQAASPASMHSPVNPPVGFATAQDNESNPLPKAFDNDDLFVFDDGDLDIDQKASPPPPEEEGDAEDSDATATEASPNPVEDQPAELSSYSKSPARSIPLPSRARVVPPPVQGVVGSYKGRSFGMDIVSPEVYAQAASFEVNELPGSVHDAGVLGRGDTQSFVASLRNSSGFAGTPRSLSERLALDDFMEEREREKAEKRAVKRDAKRRSS